MELGQYHVVASSGISGVDRLLLPFLREGMGGGIFNNGTCNKVRIFSTAHELGSGQYSSYLHDLPIRSLRYHTIAHLFT
jgi:hypothetical protein